MKIIFLLLTLSFKTYAVSFDNLQVGILYERLSPQISFGNDSDTQIEYTGVRNFNYKLLFNYKSFGISLSLPNNEKYENIDNSSSLPVSKGNTANLFWATDRYEVSLIYEETKGFEITEEFGKKPSVRKLEPSMESKTYYFSLLHSFNPKYSISKSNSFLVENNSKSFLGMVSINKKEIRSSNRLYKSNINQFSSFSFSLAIGYSGTWTSSSHNWFLIGDLLLGPSLQKNTEKDLDQSKRKFTRIGLAVDLKFKMGYFSQSKKWSFPLIINIEQQSFEFQNGQNVDHSTIYAGLGVKYHF